MPTGELSKHMRGGCTGFGIRSGGRFVMLIARLPSGVAAFQTVSRQV